MSPPIPASKSWKEHNRLHKEKRKKWREERLIKKVKKDEIEADVAESARISEKLAAEKSSALSTISIAVPGSILDNAQSSELRTYLAGQIARAACVYKIDEVVVFDDRGDVTDGEAKKLRKDQDLGEGRVACLQLARILQYLECPQYLRKYFFPIHKDLRYAGVLNPLDAPHHLRQHDVATFREGAVTNKPIKPGKGSQVNVGLANDVHVDKVLAAGLRVTVRIPRDQENSKKLKGQVVSPLAPRSETGIYWGYSVRLAANLSEIFSKCPYAAGYDLTIGTSDKGKRIDDVGQNSLRYSHSLVVFGGLAGLEAALDVDPHLNVDDPALLFDEYLNTCPEQGSRTIRTEEAVLVTLSELRTKLVPDDPPPANPQFETSARAHVSESSSEREEKNYEKIQGTYNSDSSESEET